MRTADKYAGILILMIVAFIAGGYAGIALREQGNKEREENSDVVGEAIVINDTKYEVVSIKNTNDGYVGNLVSCNDTLTLPIKQLRKTIKPKKGN